jgi:hypothetical protein
VEIDPSVPDNFTDYLEDVQKVINMHDGDGNCYNTGFVEWLKREKDKISGNKELKV